MDNEFSDLSLVEGGAWTGRGLENGAQALEDLNKALTVGYGYALADKTGGGALRLESLDETLKYVTFQEKAAAFWLASPKKKAESTVEEYTTVNDVDGAQFYAEGGVPEAASDDLRRAYEQVKFLGAIGKISDTIAVIKAQANARMVEQANKTRAMVRLADKAGWFGNSAYNSLAFDGMFVQMGRKVINSSQHIIDLRGKRMKLDGDDSINQAVTTIADNYGDPTNLRLWMSPSAKKGYLDGLLANKTYFIPGSDPNAVIGVAAKQFDVANGNGKIDIDVFMGQYPDRNPYPRLNAAQNGFASTHALAPVAPTIVIEVVVDATSKIDPGTYDYAIVAFNRFGWAAAIDLGTDADLGGVVVDAGHKTHITVTDNGSPTGNEMTGYYVYRRLSTAALITDYHYVYEAAVGASYDDGTWLPDTTRAMMIEWNPDQVFAFHQLLPLFKKPLAPIGDYEWWLQKLYVTPIVYNGNRLVEFRNVGQTAWS